jgi:hypothetical protein
MKSETENQPSISTALHPHATAERSFWSRCGDAASHRFCPLDGETLCTEARRRTGLEDFGDAGTELRLSVLLKTIERQADLHPLGRFLAWIHFRGLLRTRLLLQHAWKSNPLAEMVPIQRPIFITGMPRSGSTFLHELLAQDDQNRAPLAWEVMSPVPAPADSRIRHTANSLWWFRRLAPEADSVHPIRATTPHECIAIHSYTLLSRGFTAMFRIPAYESFLDVVSLEPAYAWQKRFLQHLQWPGPERRWVLKAPDHVFHLEELLRVFPDAIIIQTHRDPLEVLESSSRLTEVLQRVFARPQDRREIGLREARGLAEGLDRISRFREDHSELQDRFLDVNYEELVSDTFNVVRRLYRQLDLPLTPATVNRIRGLVTRRSRYQGQATKPRLADLGIDSGAETRRFANYCARFSIRQACESR